MKRIILIALMGFVFTNTMSAQTNTKKIERGVEAGVEKALRKYEAEQKKAAEEARGKEREKEQRHGQLRTQQANKLNNSLNNLNQVSAEDYISNSPRQPSRSINTKGNQVGGTQKTTTVVATPKTANNIRSRGTAFSNSGNIGTPSYSGNNYTGDRYKLKPAGFGNTQQPQYQQQQRARIPASQIRDKFKKPGRTMHQGITN